MRPLYADVMLRRRSTAAFAKALIAAALLTVTAQALPSANTASAGTAAAGSSRVDGSAPTTDDHWHVAFGVYGCDRYQQDIVSENDPAGIHTHGDGVIHIHPFPSSATGRPEITGNKVVLGVFLDVVGLRVTSTQVAMPKGARWNAGGPCPTKSGSTAPGTVRVYSYRDAADTKPIELKGDPAKIRLRNRQILSIAFVPDGVVPPVPPSVRELDDLADLRSPFLTPAEQAALPKTTRPTTLPFPKTAPKTLQVKEVVVGTGPTAKAGLVPYIRAVVGTTSNKKILDPVGWGSTGPEPLQTLGKNRMLPGLEQALIGMKVGGRREVVMPPGLAFGSRGNGGTVGPDETLVWVIDLAALRPPPR